MKFRGYKIKNKIYIFVFFITIEFFAIALLLVNNQSKKEHIINAANDLVETNYKNTYNSFETLANTVYKGYINNSKVQELFALRDRDALYNYLKEDYKYLESIDFRQIHFHLPTNHSFLRMHKPKRFGDDLTDIRYSVDYVNKNLKTITGLEMGRVVPGFRYVYPMEFDNKHTGSIETSFSVKAFVHKLEEVYDVHTHFLLKKEVFEKKIFDSYRKYYETSVESDKYIALLRKDGRGSRDIENLFRDIFRTELLEELNKGFESKKTFGLELELESHSIQHHHKVATFLLLKNIQNEHIGYFVVYQDVEELFSLESDLFKLILLVTFINLLMSFILYRESTKKQDFEKQVDIKTKELTKLNDSLEVRIKEEVEKSKEQEKQLFEIEKMAQMGEMIGNIAHQWRQPLTVISTAASGIKLQHEFGTLKADDLVKHVDGIVKNTQYLSDTIDTFRDFIKEDKKYEEGVLQDIVKTVIDITDASLHNNHIKLIQEIDYENPIKLKTISQELSQVMINILNNAKDIIKEKKIDEPWIKISIKKGGGVAILIIEDNAGGIPADILPKIFDPYFTTKHKSIGTGLGLHMSKNIVHNSLKGKLYAQNSIHGAQFFIELSL